MRDRTVRKAGSFDNIVVGPFLGRELNLYPAIWEPRAHEITTRFGSKRFQN